MRLARRLGCAALAGAVLAFAAVRAMAGASEVSIEHAGLDLSGRLDLPEGAAMDKAGGVLLVHDALAHHGAEPIASLQAGLSKRGIASLAITLSYGLNRRQGMFDCRLEQDHRNGDALDEISAWIGWLRETQRVAKVTLVGHKRGAAQALAFARGALETEVASVVALAPPLDSPETIAAAYAAAHGADLSVLLERAKRMLEAGEDDRLIEVPGFMRCAAPRVTAAAFADHYAPDRVVPLAARLAELTLPVVVVIPDQDAAAAGVKAAVAGAARPGIVVHAIAADDAAFSGPRADEAAALIASLHPRGPVR